MLKLIMLGGRNTSDMYKKNTPNGVAVCSFNHAVQRKIKNAQGEMETDFFRCVAWRGTAELLAKYCNKGDMIEVEGSLQNRSYTNKNGEKRELCEVVVSNVSFVSTGKNGENPADTGTTSNYETIDDDGDLPF